MLLATPRPPAQTGALRVWLRTLLVASSLGVLAASAGAQSDRDLHSYLDAITRLQTQGDLNPVEHFVATAPDGSLRNDALEWLAWRSTPSGANPQQSWADDPLLVAQRALRYLDSLRQPYGMPDPGFHHMKRDLAASLSGAVADAYVQRKDYSAAQPYLRQYLSLNPDDSTRLYSLAIADLYGPSPDEPEGFRALARVVNLSQGTAAGQQMAAFARSKYKERGGSDADWDRYLQVTTARGSVQIAPTSQPQLVAASPSMPAAKTTTSPATSKPGIPAPTAVPPAPTNSPAGADDTSADDTSADNDVPSNSEDMNVPYPTRTPTATGAPMSLGILVETSKTVPGSRRAVVNNLSDIVRHLRDDDEAFLVSFSNNVVFEQDLTSDPRTIEKAMDKIKPHQGAALLDAIAFASGHLQRIGKNSRKILLVISDGDDRSGQYSPSEALSSISSSGVEIYCIGMGSNSGINEARLKALARRTGGQAVFIGGARQFRTATREVASDMGIRLY